MKNYVLQYHQKGFNCSQCILKAAEAAYGIDVTQSGIKMCDGLTGGFGIGEMCSALIAGVMVLSLIFDEETVKRLRLAFLSEFQDRHGSLHCGKLKQDKNDKQCENLLVEIAGIVDDIVSAEMD